MRTSTRRTLGAMALGAAIVVLAQRLRRDPTMQRRLRHAGGQMRGLRYRATGGHPDPEVSDDILVDRIRSALGVVEKRLDVPRIHVMAQDHVALLHGVVGTDEEADEIERAVSAVSGVVGVESYIHIGLEGSDTRPSMGRAVAVSSEAHRRLVDAAMAAGVDEAGARPVVRAVLAAFADRLPPEEREQIAAHLPADVRELFTPPRRTHRAPRMRTIDELLARVAAMTPELEGERVEHATQAVLGALRSLVPEERADVAAVLPPELRRFWELSSS